MTVRMFLKRETDRARLFEMSSGRELWIPRSVCPSVLKFAESSPEGKRFCEVEVEGWWWSKNVGEEELGQRRLL